MEKFRVFFAVLTAIRSGVRENRRLTVKAAIGDSVRNNRTLTVNQIIRLSNRSNDTRTAAELRAVYDLLKPYVLKERVKRGSVRTDAVDIAELTNTYRNLVMNKKRLRREVGRALGKV